ncbi:hypothetical protein [Streptosporangium sp. 'caverna']|uniref:hypothetical protein n=1 Tax=Streptosporangium sp. 'caverna' TaxID=2202249 RepID=UPI001EF83CC9|nr:hypothetical protein [Streptosporangium sp. 'caverna']
MVLRTVGLETWNSSSMATSESRVSASYPPASIRLTLQLDGSVMVHEFPRWSVNEARTVWTALLSGGVR